jgi:hypothetical protein
MFLESSIGATIIYTDSGIYDCVARQQRTGVIVGEKMCRVTGQNFLVKVEGFNLPRLVNAGAVVAYAHPSLLQTKTAAEAAAVA